MIKNQTDNNDEKYHFAHFEKGTRYYTIILDRDLFDDWVLTIANGRIGTKLGRVRTLAFPSFTDASNQFNTITKIRTTRGYQLQNFRSYN